MNVLKFVSGLKRVLQNKGRLEIINSRGEKLDISEDMLSLMSYIDRIERENINLRENIESNKRQLLSLKALKQFVDEFKVRKAMLETNNHFQMLMKLYKGKKIDKYIYDGNLKDSDINLIELFELIDKLKL